MLTVNKLCKQRLQEAHRRLLLSDRLAFCLADMGAFTYDVSSRGGFEMLTRGGGGLSLADVSKNT